MAIRSDLMRPPVFVAQPSLSTKKQANEEDRSRKPFLDSGIANSVRKPVIINRGKNPTGVGPVL